MKRRWLLGGLLGLTLVGAGLYAGRGALAVAAMPQFASRAMTADITAALPDGLHAFVCGSGSPLADAERAGPCLAVIAGERVFLVDVGEGAAKTLNLEGVPIGEVDAVLLTHFHSDHFDGLGALTLQRWVAGSRSTPLDLFGTEGVEQIASGINLAYAQDREYRIAHHGQGVAPRSGFGLAPRPFATPRPGAPTVVLEQDGLKITAFAVDHDPVKAAVGYRFDYRGRSLAVSGDTHRSPSLEQAAAGADLLVHEALSPKFVAVLGEAAAEAGRPNLAKVMADIPSYHATPRDAAASAKAAGVRALLLTHLIPPLPVRALEEPFLEDARDAFDGPIWLARDGDLVSLPAGGDRIDRRR
jgi:ribonuclease Z